MAASADRGKFCLKGAPATVRRARSRRLHQEENEREPTERVVALAPPTQKDGLRMVQEERSFIREMCPSGMITLPAIWPCSTCSRTDPLPKTDLHRTRPSIGRMTTPETASVGDNRTRAAENLTRFLRQAAKSMPRVRSTSLAPSPFAHVQMPVRIASAQPRLCHTGGAFRPRSWQSSWPCLWP